MVTEILTLPSTKDGDPDWDYMENYMREMEENLILTYIERVKTRVE